MVRRRRVIPPQRIPRQRPDFARVGFSIYLDANCSWLRLFFPGKFPLPLPPFIFPSNPGFFKCDFNVPTDCGGRHLAAQVFFNFEPPHKIATLQSWQESWATLPNPITVSTMKNASCSFYSSP